jgi:hypothetical protein
MPALLDLHAPPAALSESLIVSVDAPAEDLRAAIARLDVAGVRTLGADARGRVLALALRPGVELVWDLRVEPGDDDGSFLCSTRRYVVADAEALAELRGAWGHLRGVADALARRTVRAVALAAAEVPARELALAA